MQAKFLRMGRRHCEWCEDLPHRRESPHCPVCLLAPSEEHIPHGDEGVQRTSMLGRVMVEGLVGHGAQSRVGVKPLTRGR